MSQSLREIFEGFPERFLPGRLERSIIYYFSLGGGADEKWTILVDGERCTVEPGKSRETCDAVLKCSPDYFRKLISGYTPGAMDFMRGRIKTNDVELLKTFREIFQLS